MNTLLIEGVIGQQGDDSIVKGEKFFSFVDLINFIDSNGGKPFEVIIKSPGGSVEEGFKIYDELKKHDATITAITANSIASVIFLSGKIRRVVPHSEIIIHNSWVDGEALTGEKINYHTLSALTEIFAKTDIKILDAYSTATGSGNVNKLLALMAEETNIGAQGALDLGFATELIESDSTTLQFKNRVITYCQNQINLIQTNKKEEMETNERLSAFEKTLKGLKNLFKVNLKNMSVSTTEGVELYIGGEGEEKYVGKIAYIAVEGLPTDQTAPVGTHVLSNGDTIVVSDGGLVTEASEAPAPEDVEALKASYEEEKQNMLAEFGKKEEEMNARITAMEEEKLKAIDTEKKFQALVLDFEKLKNEIVGDPDHKQKDNQTISKEDFSKLSYGEKIKMRAMAKATK